MAVIGSWVLGDYDFFVGIDWATESHAVCVLDRERQVVMELDVLHNGDELARFVKRLEKLAPLERIAASISRRAWRSVEAPSSRRSSSEGATSTP